MPPSLVSSLGHFTVPRKETLAPENKFHYEPGHPPIETPSPQTNEDLLPVYPDIHENPLGDIPYEDRGLRGDPKFRTLFSAASDVYDVMPKIGTEIRGLDLGKINDAQRDELARLVAVRGVVFFRDQTGFDVSAQRELGRYLGRLYKVCSWFWMNEEGSTGRRVPSWPLVPSKRGFIESK